MKKILAASALAGTLLLGSCTSTGQVDMSKVASVISQVQQAVATACAVVGQVVPDAAAIVALLGTGNAAVQTVAGLAGAIEAAACPASAPARLLGDPAAPAAVTVHGVQVGFIKFGRFTGK
jgi:hypothetical protein